MEWSEHFTQQIVMLAAAHPVVSHVSLVGRAGIGLATGGDSLPLHYRFFLGGTTRSGIFPDTHIPFMGFEPEALSATSARWALWQDVQSELVSNVVVTIRGDVATLSGSAATLADVVHATGSRTVAGLGLSVGTPTVLGPVELTFGGRSDRQRPLVDISLGFVF